MPYLKLLKKIALHLPLLGRILVQRDLAIAERNRALIERDVAIEQLKKVNQVPLFVPPGHFYSPIVDPSKVEEKIRRIESSPVVDSLPGLNLDRSEIQLMWKTLLPYLESCPFTESAKDGFRYYYENPFYSYGDGSILHAMLRHFKPKRLIEVGSGWSSACTLDTVEQFLDCQCDLTFIEPYPEILNSLIGATKLPIEIFVNPVQQTPLSLFSTLESGDILFIDSTHILATGSDVCFEILEVLPSLKSGVIVHFHDIFWPFEYPSEWVIKENRSWNELYCILAFLMNNQEWKILFFNDFFSKVENELILATFPIYEKNPGGALWLIKQ